MSFVDNSKVVTVTTQPGGESKSSIEKYRVVDNILIVNGEDHLINATYSVSGDQLVVVAESFRAVLERL